MLLITFLCLGIGFTFYSIWDINRLKTEILSNLTINAKQIGDNCIVPLTFDDKLQATKALARLGYFDFVERGALYDKEGNLFAVYPDTVDRSTFLALNEQANSIFKNSYFYVKADVLFQDEVYGTIFLKANSEPIAGLKKNLLSIISLLTLVLVFLSFIIAERMQRYISSPIIKLKKHFDKIAENQDFSVQLTRQSNDEIGSLYDGFNNLLNQIQIRSKERDMAEESLRASEEKYKNLIKFTPLPLCIADNAEKEVVFNKISRNFESMWGHNNKIILDLS